MDQASLRQWLESGRVLLADHTSLLFLAIVFLPGFGFPLSALLILAGAAWGPTWQSCGIALAAVALNMTWTYFVAAGPAHGWIGKRLGNRWQRWRELPDGDLLKLLVVLRVTPGLPLCVQNYILGLLRVPFGRYLAVSLPLTGVFVLGFVFTGGAVFNGRTGLAVTGGCVLVVAILVVRLLRARLAGGPEDPASPS